LPFQENNNIPKFKLLNQINLASEKELMGKLFGNKYLLNKNAPEAKRIIL